MAQVGVIYVLSFASIAGFVAKGITGFGSAIIILCVWAVALHLGLPAGTLQQAVISECVTSTLLAIPLLVATNAHRTWDWRLVLSISSFQAAGAPIGAALLQHLNPRYVELVMACVLLLLIGLQCHTAGYFAALLAQLRRLRPDSKPSYERMSDADGFTKGAPLQQQAGVAMHVPGRTQACLEVPGMASDSSTGHGASAVLAPAVLPCASARSGVQAGGMQAPLEAHMPGSCLDSVSTGSSCRSATYSCPGLGGSGSDPLPWQQLAAGGSDSGQQQCQPQPAEQLVAGGQQEGHQQEQQPLLTAVAASCDVPEEGHALVVVQAVPAAIAGAGKALSVASAGCSHSMDGKPAAKCDPAAAVTAKGTQEGGLCWGPGQYSSWPEWWQDMQQPQQLRTNLRVLALASVAGTSSGLMAGMTGMGGPPVMYMYTSLQVPKAVVRGSNAIQNLLQWRIIAYISLGSFKEEDHGLYIACGAAGAVGLVLGSLATRYVNQAAFGRVMVFLMCLCCGLMFLAAAGSSG